MKNTEFQFSIGVPRHLIFWRTSPDKVAAMPSSRTKKYELAWEKIFDKTNVEFNKNATLRKALVFYIAEQQADLHFGKKPLERENYLRKIFLKKNGAKNLISRLETDAAAESSEKHENKYSSYTVMMHWILTTVYKHALSKAKGNAKETAKVHKAFTALKKVVK